MADLRPSNDPNTGGTPAPCKATTDARLQALDRPQLIQVIRRLLKSAPDLEDLVFLPVTGEDQPVNAKYICVQVTGILLNMGDDWRASTGAEQELWPLVAIGTQYLDSDQLTDARTVFNAIITTILAYYARIWDHESEVAGIVEDCVKGLASCLEKLTAPHDREALLKDIFAVYRWDVLGEGGYGLDTHPRTVLLVESTAAERIQIASWVQQALPDGEHKHTRWKRQAGGRFVLELRAPSSLDDAELESLYARADLVTPHLDLLLSQERRDEAVRLVQQASGEAVVALAETLIAAGLTKPAIAAVHNHSSVLHKDHQRTRDWLRAHGVDLPDEVDRLVWTITSFNRNPTIGDYKKIREGAGAIDQWPQVLNLLKELAPDRTKLMPIRARRFADLGQVDQAITELGRLRDSSWRSCAADLAETFEAHHSSIAIDLYKQLADERQAVGTRAACRKAAVFRARLAALAG